MAQHRGRGRPRHPDVLTPAEWEVLDWLRHGVSRREIARRRGTSLDAVKYHVANIAAKLGIDGGSTALRLWPGHPATSAIAARAANRALARPPGRPGPAEPGTAQPAGPPRSPEKEHSMPSTGLRLGAIGQVALYAREVKRAEAFYRDTLGLPHIFTFGDLAFFDMGGVRLYVHAVGDEKWKPGSHIYFLVDDIDAAYEELGARGVRFSGAPHSIYRDDETGVEEWMAFFEDTEGNALAIMSRVAPEAGTEATAAAGAARR